MTQGIMTKAGGEIEAENSPERLSAAAVRAPRPYFYVAVGPTGSRLMGVSKAPDAAGLAQQLRRRRAVLLRSWGLPSLGGGGVKPATLKEQAQLHTQLAQLLSRGVPLVEALDVVAGSVGRRTGLWVAHVRDQVAAGWAFADACQRAGALDEVTVAVYRAAERSGDLAGAATQLAATARRQLTVAGKAVTLMIYPAIVLTISVLVSLGIVTFLLPKIGSSLKDAGGELPFYTRAMIALGQTLRDNIVVVMLLAGGLFAAAWAARRRLAALAWALARRLPVLGQVCLAQELCRFFTVMAAMTRSGVVLADALAVAKGVVGDPALQAQLARLRARLVEGGLLRRLLDEVTLLPLATRRLLIAAERSGDMQAAFELVASDMAEEVDRGATRALAVLEPLLIVLMFLMIGSLVLSIMVPILTMAGSAGA